MTNDELRMMLNATRTFLWEWLPEAIEKANRVLGLKLDAEDKCLVGNGLNITVEEVKEDK